MPPAAAPPNQTKMAPARATLRLCPTTRPVARKPEALPCRERGTAPRRALLFGDWNMACPAPMTIKRHTISQTELWASNWLIRRSPRQAIANPPAASQRVPIRSARAPLNEASIGREEDSVTQQFQVDDRVRDMAFNYYQGYQGDTAAHQGGEKDWRRPA